MVRQGRKHSVNESKTQSDQLNVVPTKADQVKISKDYRKSKPPG
jgi:hypothetical protein